MVTIDATKKCISIYGYRDRGSEHFDDYPARHLDTIPGALSSLMIYELGYGGSIVDIKDMDGRVTIITKTRAMACIDTTMFEGAKEDMLPLLEAVRFYLRAVNGYDDQVRERVVQQLDLDGKGSSALIVTHLSPLLMGGHRVKIAMLLACGLEDEAQIKRALHLEGHDLAAALELTLAQPNQQLSEVLDQLGL